MSANGSEALAEAISILLNEWLQSCCVVAGVALVLYDHLTTISREVQLIWGRKWTSVILLFYLNRWITVVWVLSTLTDFLPIATIPSCKGITYLQDGLNTALFIIWSAFSAIRTYAISDVTNLSGNYFDTWFQMVNIPFVGIECIEGSTISTAATTKFTIGTRVCVIASDAVVLLATWYKTYAMRRDARLLNIDSPLTSALLRDGTAYFLLLLLLNILQILGNATLVFIYVGNYLSPPLYSLVITHFLLSLRQVNWSSTDTVTDGMLPSFVRSQRDEPQSTSLHSSIRFASFVDNMGEILVHDRAGVDPAAGEVPWHEEGDVQESW